MTANVPAPALPAQERLELLFPPAVFGEPSPPYPSEQSEIYDYEISAVMQMVFKITDVKNKPVPGNYAKESVFRVKFIEDATFTLIAVNEIRKWNLSVLQNWEKFELRDKRWLEEVFGKDQLHKLDNANIRACVRGCEVVEKFCKALEERIGIEKDAFFLTDRYVHLHHFSSHVSPHVFLQLSLFTRFSSPFFLHYSQLHKLTSLL